MILNAIKDKYFILKNLNFSIIINAIPKDKSTKRIDPDLEPDNGIDIIKGSKLMIIIIFKGDDRF